jgi:hypothetical protein
MVAQPTQHTATLLSKQRQHQQQQQQLQEEPSLQSVNSLSMFPDPSTSCDGGSRTTAGAALGTAAAAAAAAAARSVSPGLNAARLHEQRQHALVVSACKALGSSAAADAYVAALPTGLLAVNLSAAGITDE